MTHTLMTHLKAMGYSLTGTKLTAFMIVTASNVIP